ncbi:stage II sporulation protein M [Staphylococcus auricularis]|uniref:stage II sporulation protein M n=1 Tax=Staphylococcus auricularis TaxID=29379 RepID=UPI001EF1A260|nr:stage II sporulation protein M [Staphylococcus auricularis]MCG7342184.1 stage II sporulation protein M [Staphylococcus auricularis]
MLKIQDNTYIKRTLKFFIVPILITTITVILAIIFSPSAETFNNMLSDTNLNSNEASGLEKILNYIINNGFRVPFQMLILAIIPIPFLYYINILSTSILTGIALGFAISLDAFKGSMMLISSLPHFILEVIGLCVVASGLFLFNKAIINKIISFFNHDKSQTISVKVAFTDLLKMYFSIALPYIIIAAFMETYVADTLFDLLT